MAPLTHRFSPEARPQLYGSPKDSRGAIAESLHLMTRAEESPSTTRPERLAALQIEEDTWLQGGGDLLLLANGDSLGCDG